MGSRYGGLKQMDEIGPGGEAIIDYSMYDAIQAGFGKIVFIIRHDFSGLFKTFIEPRLKNRIDYDFAYQSLDKIPPGFSLNPEREKPWGTAHAVLMAADLVKEPMAVINADDFYGRESFLSMAEFLNASAGAYEYAMIGYHLYNTLSEHGTVSRGICLTDQDGYLTGVVERTKIKREEEGIFFYEQEGRFPLREDSPVSMNFWGLKPSVFPYLQEGFAEFLRINGNDPKAEYFIPTVINDNILRGKITTKVLSCNASWFGITYREDKPKVKQQMRELINRGVYPESLWT